jgi:voltage-gated sodium channel
MGPMFRVLVSETAVIAVILLSTLALFAYGFTSPGTTEHGVWLAIDVACVSYFVIEALIKIRVDHWDVYINQPWNRFDLVIVVLSLPVLVAPITTDAIAFIGVPVLRLARLFRLFRLLRIIPKHDRLGAGVVRAMRASVGVFLAIAIVNFIFAMGAHVLFDRAAPDYFGNPGRACYSMFRIFTIEGWNEIPDAISVNASYALAVFARIYFGVAVVVGGILGLSIGNAVFVDQMMADNTDVVEENLATLTIEVRALRDEIRALRAAQSE